MANQIKRLNYFKHQFLRASDFIDEQQYHVEMRRRHNRMLHTWGVAGNGLKVTFAQGATAVNVSPGMAVDSQGREIIITEDRSVELSGFQPGAPVYVVISYAEKQTDASNETGAEGNTRWTEEPLLQALPAKPADVGLNLILGRVTRNQTTVTGVDESERRTAGVEAGELTVRTLTLSRPNIDAGTWPRLSCSAPNQAALENGGLKLDANREVFFADNGQLRSLDNAHRIVFNRANNRLELHEFGDILFLTGGGAPTEKLRIGAAGHVGIGRTASAEKLEVQGNIRAFSLSFMDAAGTTFPDTWLGMASNIEGATKWLHIGGITDAGARRMTLQADRIHAGGRLGIGVTAPETQLHISGGQWNVADTEGDFKIGSAALRLKIGVALGGAGAGDVRIRAVGGTNRLMLGSGANDTVLISGSNVAIGNSDPKRTLHVEGHEIHSGGPGAGFSFAQRDNNGPFVENGAGGSRWVWHAGGGVARLWSSNDKLTVATNGDLTITGALRAGNSDIYFTDTAHNHTGIGNATSFAAIENAANYGALMILGRNVGTPNAVKRIVKLWDFLEVNGDLTVTGILRAPAKQGFVVDDFINRHGDALEQGDVVVIGGNQSSLFYGLKGNLPVPEVDIAQGAYDTRVCGIVNELLVQSETGVPGAETPEGDAAPKKPKKAKGQSGRAASTPQLAPQQTFTADEMEKLDSTQVGPGQFGTMVTHGAYAYCKVDADIAPVKVGDLLTTSPTKGHAQKVLDPAQAAGAIIGKALGSLKKGRGKIPVLVTL